jgi:hypothetical protein
MQGGVGFCAGWIGAEEVLRSPSLPLGRLCVHLRVAEARPRTALLCKSPVQEPEARPALDSSSPGGTTSYGTIVGMPGTGWRHAGGAVRGSAGTVSAVETRVANSLVRFAAGVCERTGIMVIWPRSP